MPEIDAVVTWVDDQDARWRSTRDSYAVEEGGDPFRVQDYRDWDNLLYFFRAIDEFCPWIRRLHLVTVNPPPAWLDTSHPRLNVVHHEDYIPAEYLPTFNSHVIEIHLHRIPGLSDNFVYFNDDTFPLRSLTQEHFFPRGRPAGVGAMTALSVGDPVNHAALNGIDLINRNFDKRTVIRRNLPGWFVPRYGARFLLQNLLLLPWPRFTGFHNPHLPQPLRRSAFEQVWAIGRHQLEQTSRSRFRRFSDVNPLVFTYWQICSGDFSPVSLRDYGQYYQLGVDSAEDVARAISTAAHATVCINDDGDISDAEDAQTTINEALGQLLPRPSSFELD